jgi:motility quorum-sensing regulator / GCU-specific mRNA interferase toxin
MDEPTYDLAWIQHKVRAGEYRTTRAAAAGASELGFDEGDIVACICALTWADFFKTMESDRRPGLWQDVYRPVYDGHQVYLKLQMHHDSQAVVIQFKAR